MKSTTLYIIIVSSLAATTTGEVLFPFELILTLLYSLKDFISVLSCSSNRSLCWGCYDLSKRACRREQGCSYDKYFESCSPGDEKSNNKTVDRYSCWCDDHIDMVHLMVSLSHVRRCLSPKFAGTLDTHSFILNATNHKLKSKTAIYWGNWLVTTKLIAEETKPMHTHRMKSTIFIQCHVSLYPV